MVGGGIGQRPNPGEVNLAHNGVLFMEELPEFNRATLEVLRHPMQEGTVHIRRAMYSVTYPSAFMLVAAILVAAEICVTADPAIILVLEVVI